MRTLAYRVRANISLGLEARSLASFFKVGANWVKAIYDFIWKVSRNPEYDLRATVDCTGVFAHDHHTNVVTNQRSPFQMQLRGHPISASVGREEGGLREEPPDTLLMISLGIVEVHISKA
jgi:hypothetical protein